MSLIYITTHVARRGWVEEQGSVSWELLLWVEFDESKTLM